MQIQTQPIPELFYLYCALNYNGYDKENNKEGMHPLRVFVREELAKKDLPQYNFKYHPFQYTKQILTTRGLQSTSQTNPDFLAAIEYVAEFKNESGLEKLWPEAKKETEQEHKKYLGPLGNIESVLGKCFDFKPSGVKKVFFTVNLLESYLRGFSISVQSRAYIIIGPSQEPNVRNLLHEFVHLYLANVPLEALSAAVLEKIYQVVPETAKNYSSENLLKESLVRALVVHLSRRVRGVPEQAFTKTDEGLFLPALLLKSLENNSPPILSWEYLKKIGNSIEDEI